MAIPDYYVLGIGFVGQSEGASSHRYFGINYRGIYGHFFTSDCRPAFASSFRKLSFNARVYVSWVGLRGAVPIIFATYPLVANIPHAREMFNIVFFITLVSLIVQGSTIPVFAKLSSLCHRNEETKKSDFGFDIEFPEEVKSAMSEVKITQESLKNGTKLMEIPLPDKSLVVMVKRGTRFFIPRGNTHLEENDTLLIITDDEAALTQTYKDLGLKGYKV